MTLAHLALRSLLGRRLPITSGPLRVHGLSGAVEISRDRWGVPYIRADNDADAWFGLGFCHAQDRLFQLESLLRVGRGTLSEIVGGVGLPIDRLSRRIGFHRSAERQLGVLSTEVCGTLSAYARGINAGATDGRRRRPHEFVFLRAAPSAWTAGDALAVSKLQSFYLASSWDSELARLRILDADGPDALAALEPEYPQWLPSSMEPSRGAGPALNRLQDDLAHLAAVMPAGGASNNWALDATRTATGRPILANDPHLAAVLPPHWYLCRIQTPEWSAAGASFVGGPAITAGHNGFCAWGLTAGCVDNADLFIEELGPDGRSVRQGSELVACPVYRELIQVRGGTLVVEEVLETPRGPVIGPALNGEDRAISLRAVWLDPLPIEGLLGVERTASFEEFRERFRHWPGPSLNMIYADVTGRIGWQLAGQAPVRRKGHGSIPLRGSDPDAGWEGDLIPFEAMPHADGPDRGFIATANARPAGAGVGPFLGEDWLDGYRLARIAEALDARRDWDVSGVQELQLDVQSLPWREIRDLVLALEAVEGDARTAQNLLRQWDGRVGSSSAAATVFELFTTEMIRRVVTAKAPNSTEIALARGFSQLQPQTTFALRRMSQLVRLLQAQPDGWFERGWAAEIRDALGAAIDALRLRHGDDPASWGWGQVRPLTLRHPLSARRPLGRLFNLGPISCGGDTNTIAQASVDPLDPTANPGAVAALRMVIDVGDWDQSRFALPGGQSGNPLSPHYADQLRFWRIGKGVPIAWSEQAVRRAVRETLRLTPA